MKVAMGPAQALCGLEGQQLLAWHSGPCSAEPELPLRLPVSCPIGFPQPRAVLLGHIPHPFASAARASWDACPCFSLLCRRQPVLLGPPSRPTTGRGRKPAPRLCLQGITAGLEFSTKCFAGVSLDSPLRMTWELAKLDFLHSSGQEDGSRS